MLARLWLRPPGRFRLEASLVELGLAGLPGLVRQAGLAGE